MSDASFSADPQDFEALPGRPVRDLNLAECEQAVATLNAEHDAIMAQMKRHETDLSSRPPGWRLSAQTALGWKKRVRTAINVRAQDLKMGPKAKAAARFADLRRLAEDTAPGAIADVREKAEALAAFLEEACGGEWRVDLDLDVPFVMIRQV